MLRAAFLTLVATTIVPISAAVQVPLNLTTRPNFDCNRQLPQTEFGNEQWNLDKFPNPNATDHLVFETVHSLLQQWPNTRMRNGHNIVPGRIPKGTLLYHGRTDKNIPPGPEWVATDPEHAYVFCRVLRKPQSICWQLTLATTRSLKVIYFDGSSAAKLPYGSMDTQDLIIWGRPGTHNIQEEAQRIEDLCKWGKKFGVDGFVRMELDFEVMLCDFTSGVSVVSFVNLVTQSATAPVTSDSPSFEILNAGFWHNQFPGETRIQLDLAGLISFYDTQLAPSLIDARAGHERWDYRVQNVSRKELSAAKSRLEAILTRQEGLSSGIDWKALIRVIVDRYAGRLELTRYLLNSIATEPHEILDLANKTQTQLRIMLTPYLLSSAMPSDRSNKEELNWSIPIYKLCATMHTYSMEVEIESMTDSEKLLLRAVRETTREICRVVTKMWAAGVHAGIDMSFNATDSADIGEVTCLLNSWAGDLDRLMGWLDWSMWVKCNPGCGPEEVCYLPTWPIGFPSMDNPPPPSPDGSHPTRSFGFRSMATERIAESELDDWIRPQPRCIRRVGPYDV